MKRIKFILKKYLFGSLLASILLSASNISAMEQYPYYDPQQGYGIKNDASPWFDGKDYPFFREMYDGKSLKPQEEGSYQKFPQNSVPVRTVLGKIVKNKSLDIKGMERDIFEDFPPNGDLLSMMSG